MRNLEAEQKFLMRIFSFAGLIFVLGLIAIAVGTELLILTLWPDEIQFWIWQGVWAIVHAIIISTIATTIKRNQPKV
jgi:hypothetical protein